MGGRAQKTNLTYNFTLFLPNPRFFLDDTIAIKMTLDDENTCYTLVQT